MILQCKVVHEDVPFPYAYEPAPADAYVASSGMHQDDIGLAFPLKMRPGRAEPRVDSTDARIAEAIQSKEAEDDYVAKLGVPLTNMEQMLRMLMKFAFEWLVIYAMRIKNTYLIGNIVLQDTESYAKTRAQLDNIQIEVVNDARKRMAEGDDNWFREAMVKEGDTSKSIVERRWDTRGTWVKDLVFKKEKITAHDVAWWRHKFSDSSLKEADRAAREQRPNVPLVPVPMPQLVADEGHAEEPETVGASLRQVDVFAAPEAFQAQAQTVSDVKDDALQAQLRELKEGQAQLTEMMQEQRKEREAEEKAAAAELERERKDNTAMRTKFGAVSSVFRKFKAIGHFGGNLATSGSNKLIAGGTVQTMLRWLASIPVEKIFNPTYLRARIDAAVFHPLGLHKGSYVYNVANGLLKKMWFILEPFVKGFSKMTLIVTDVLHKFLEKYAGMAVMGLANYHSYAAFVFNWYVKVIYIFSSYFFSLWFAIWWWCIMIIIAVVRFILNLVLSRFGISI